MDFVDKIMARKKFYLFIEDLDRVAYILDCDKESPYREYCFMANLSGKHWYFTCWRNTGPNPGDMEPVGLRANDFLLLYFKSLKLRAKRWFTMRFNKKEMRELVNDHVSYEASMKNKKTVEFGTREKEYEDE